MHHPLPAYEIKLPNPFFEGENRVYLIGSEPLTLIDTGVATKETYDSLVDAMRKLKLDIQDVGRVILTHKHIDHIGNAWRIQQETGAEVLIHEADAHAIENVDPEGGRFDELVRERMKQWHLSTDQFQPRSTNSSSWEIEDCRATIIKDGQKIELDQQATQSSIQVINTPGHTLGSICLLYGSHLFSGDHVLEHISPNIGIGDMKHRGLLAKFYESLNRVEQLDRSDLTVMPGHGASFQGLSKRCQYLIKHHDKRLDKIRAVLEKSEVATVYEIAQGIFRRLKDYHILLGCAEVASHLDYLEMHNQVSQTDGHFRLLDD